MHKISALLLALIALTVRAAEPLEGNYRQPLTTGLHAKAKPCVDFYRHVNGLWVSQTPLPPGESWWGVWQETLSRKDAVLEKALSQAAAKSTSYAAGSLERNVADYYASGMDVRQIQRVGLAPLASEFARIDAVRSKEDLLQAIARLHRIGVDAAFSLGIHTDARDSSRYLVGLYQGGLGHGRNFYFATDDRTKTNRAAYAKYIVRMFTLLGDKATRAQANASTVLALETSLARAWMTGVEERDVDRTYNKMKLSELSARATGVDWPRYFDLVGLRPDEINVGQPAFVKRFAELFVKVPLSDWKTYLRLRLIDAAAPQLSSPYENAHFNLYGRVLNGLREMLPRSKRIIRDITNGTGGDTPLAMAAGKIYVAQAFSPESKVRVEEMVRTLRDTLRERLQKLEWMSDSAKKEAVAKLDATIMHVGYPDRWPEYPGLEVDRGPYVLNWLRANEHDLEVRIGRLGKAVERDEWFVSPAAGDNSMDGQQRKLVFPAAMLQPPYFDPQADDAVNYGAIGMRIGHELTHIFDDQGRKFDSSGNRRDWWTDVDEKRYRLLESRVIDQYGRYRSRAGTSNPKLTLGENISDIGGLQIAYFALKRSLRDNPLVNTDGLTVDQRFFISFARSWRRKGTLEAERNWVKDEERVHSFPWLRVRGAVANMPEFARAFSCKPDERAMRAAKDHIRIW